LLAAPLIEEIKDLRATLNETQELLANTCLRTKVIENTIFAKNEDGEIIKNEDNKPVLSPDLQANVSPIEPAKQEPTLSPKTTLEKKAVAFAEWLLKKP
jgi:hypothetical protein